MNMEVQLRGTFGKDALALRGEGRDEGACGTSGKHRPGAPASAPEGRRRRSFRAAWLFAAAVLLHRIAASAEITGVRIARDETIPVGEKMVRHVLGVVSGKAERNEPGVPTLDKVVGLKYESDFELWLPAAAGNGRFWFSVLNRGNDVGDLRDGILRRGGAVRLVRLAGQERGTSPNRS